VHPSFILERLSGPQGYGSLAHNIFASIFLTPTGLPIEREPITSVANFTDFTIVQMNKVAEDRVEASLDLAMQVPADLPAGYYVLLGRMFFSDPLLGEFPNDMMIQIDKVGLRWSEGVYLPVIRVGDPAPPRLFWTLLTDTLSNGTRGVGAVEDRERFALAPRILAQSETFIIPKVDSASGAPLTYRLEPFAPTVSRGDRGVLPAPPLIPFQFPSGSLTVRILKPDGTIDVLGPAPFVQARTRSLVDRNGETLGRGGGHMTDVYQLSTMDPQFEVQFTQEGRHVITLNGNVEDIWGNTWSGGGTYYVHVARLLSLDTAVLPGTPLEVEDTFNPGLVLNPPVPADVEVCFQLAPNSEVSQMVRQVVRGRANRFGYFQPGAGGIPLDRPGEYRVDMVASYRDEKGNLWMGSRTWGSVIALPNSDMIAHGRRATDAVPLGPLWFFHSEIKQEFGDGHVFLPFHSGDITWAENSDSIRPELTLQDPQGEVVDLLRERALTQFGDFDERSAAGEIPLFSSRPELMDAHLDPSKVDLWGYSYRSIQRPLVRVREELTEDSMSSLYWRFDEQYAKQFGVGANGDLPNDIKFQFGATVLRGPVLPEPQYGIYGSLFVLVPDEDPRGGTRTFPPFQGAAGGPSGGPIMTLKGKEVDIFFHPTGTRPGSILEVGDVASFVGQIGPTLPSKVEITVTAPSGKVRQISGQANKVGYFYDPSTDFIVEEPGSYRVKVKVWHDGLTSAGPVQEPFPSGDVLGSNEGEFFFYVMESDSEELGVDIPRDSFVRPAEGPIQIPIRPGEDPPTDMELHFTTVMPGFLLEEGRLTPNIFATGDLNYSYDAPRLHEDFPNLDLFDSDNRAGADTITMSFLLSGSKGGEKVYQARQVLLQGEELLALPHRRPLEGFGQFGNGQGITSSLILVNPSAAQKAMGTARFQDTEGDPLDSAINGQPTSNGRFALEVPARGVGFFETDGTGQLVTGSVQLTSNVPLGGTILFSGDFGVAGVGIVRPQRTFLVPVESKASEGVRTGLALANSQDAQVQVTVRLHESSGAELASKTLTLPAGGQLARFAEELFPERDFSSFQGSLQVDSAEALIGMAIRLSPGQFATLPVTSPAIAGTTLRFAQFGDGEGISSTLILVNPFNEAASGTVSLFGSEGSALSVDVNGSIQNGSFAFSIPARGVGFYATDGEGELVSGSVEVTSNLPIGGTILFAGSFGVAGVGSVDPMAHFLVPVESDTSGQIQTGVALANPTSSQAEITLTLRDSEGVVIPQGSTCISLSAHTQVAQFPEQIFADKNIDFSSFRGTLEVGASVPVVGMAIRVSPGEFATLTVTLMN
ncbi:hypothetical protein MYX84_08595, partial [Acidobacteria bacterium AH-259-O06]|nr:hypothetical protein [Acidobacteria bacterium AH-259-O06]